jgi:hypothetical protein
MQIEPVLSESQEQCLLVAWFRIQYPKYKLNLFSIPNGAVLSGDNRARAIQMNRLKAEGLVSGVSDLLLAIPASGYSGLFIEMKSIKGVASDDQKKFVEQMRNSGYRAEFCFGYEQAKGFIKNYLTAVIYLPSS